MGEEDKIIKKGREVSWCILNKRKGGPGMYIKRFVKHYYIMLIPALLWLFFFSIVPMFGIVMAFQDYNPGQGILHSKFVWLENFKYMFQMNDVKQVLCNTVVIAVGKIIGNIIFPLILHFCLMNSVLSGSSVQSRQLFTYRIFCRGLFWQRLF